MFSLRLAMVISEPALCSLPGPLLHQPTTEALILTFSRLGANFNILNGFQPKFTSVEILYAAIDDVVAELLLIMWLTPITKADKEVMTSKLKKTVSSVSLR